MWRTACDAGTLTAVPLSAKIAAQLPAAMRRQGPSRWRHVDGGEARQSWTLRTVHIKEVDDHARKQVKAVLSRRDLDDLGLGQAQPERPPRPTLPSRPSVHACTTSGPPSTRRPLDRITQPPRHRDRRDSVHQPRTLPLSDAHRSIRVRDRSVVSRGHAIRTQSRPRAVTVRHPITGHNNPDHHGKLLASCGVFA